MGIKSQDIILLDFQTTGTVAADSDIIEAGFGLYRADLVAEEPSLEIHLIALEEDKALSKTIQKLTGLKADYYQTAPSITAEELKVKLRNFLTENEGLPIIIHYAQFKLPFLRKVLGDEEFSSRVVCIHKLSKRMIPGLKSYSLRAVAGYLGYATAEKKRSLDHLRATAKVWQNLAALIGDKELPEDLVPWLKDYTPAGELPAKLAINEEGLRKKRLSLPHSPGVYFFLDRFGNILYVGKALDLHHRVNSYFRGRKTKGSRLNEMLTRASDFRFVTVSTELEALIRENDEIKENDPPYNRLLRSDGRSLTTIRFNDLLPNPRMWGHRPFGPLTSLWMIEALEPFLRGGEILERLPKFIQGITEPMIGSALQKLFASYGITLDRPPEVDDWFLLAQKAWPIEYQRLLERQNRLEEEQLDEPADLETEELKGEVEEVWTEEDIESYIREAFLHLYRIILRSRWHIRLADCDIEWEFKHSQGVAYPFSVRDGKIEYCERSKELSYRTFFERLNSFDMQVYDRMGIIYAEMKKGLKRGDKICLHLSPSLALSSDELKRFVMP